MITNYALKNFNCRDQTVFSKVILLLDNTFSMRDDHLIQIRDTARKIKTGIERIDTFIQLSTQAVCPSCREICCTSQHGYYNSEDLLYQYVLGTELRYRDFGKSDTEPCHFLRQNGCCMERWLRPAGCTWYFCDALLEDIEARPDYRSFDDSLRDIADLWLRMLDEFAAITPLRHP